MLADHAGGNEGLSGFPNMLEVYRRSFFEFLAKPADWRTSSTTFVNGCCLLFSIPFGFPTKHQETLFLIKRRSTSSAIQTCSMQASIGTGASRYGRDVDR